MAQGPRAGRERWPGWLAIALLLALLLAAVPGASTVTSFDAPGGTEPQPSPAVPRGAAAVPRVDAQPVPAADAPPAEAAPPPDAPWSAESAMAPDAPRSAEPALAPDTPRSAAAAPPDAPRSAEPALAPDTPRSAAATPPVPTPVIVYRFSADLAETDRRQIRAGIELARRHLPPVRRVVVRAGSGVRPAGAATAHPDSGDDIAVAGSGRIEVYTASSAYQEDGEVDHLLTMIHEYYHLVQEQLMARSRPSADSDEPFVPLWLIEGSAEWVAAQVGVAAGLRSYQEQRESFVAGARASQVPLERFEREASDEQYDPYGDDPYSVGFMAVELIGARYGGQPALLRFWSAVGASGDWRAAFRESFGMTPRRFFGEFAAWRRAGFPPAT